MLRSPCVTLLCAALLAVTASGCATTPGGAPVTDGGTATSETVPGTVTAPSNAVTSFAPGAPWPRIRLEPVAEGFTQPLYVTAADAEPDRLLVVEKVGRVRALRAGEIEAEPFLDVSGLVSAGSEQGLLSIAFPPGEASAERVYVYYTDTSGDVVIARFALSGGRADASSRQEVLRVAHRRYPNHNGGQLAFGPDGMLYAGLGDGGGGGDPDGNGQRLDVLLGKLLRLDVEGKGASGPHPKYAVPPDNPFVSRKGARPEIWAHGLRNPWRFSFDSATGDLYIADVGQNAWEEIDFQPAGRGGLNYGWDRMEGLHRFEGGPAPGLTPPVAEYGRDLGISVTGGYVYRGTASPSLRGVYLFADYGSGRVWGLRREDGAWRTRELLDTDYAVSSFGRDTAGEVYLTDIDGGAVYRVTAR